MSFEPHSGHRPGFDLLICDLDGTLVDTRDGIAATLRATLEEAGFPAPPPSEVYPLIGLPLDTLFRRFLPEASADGLAARLVEAYRDRYRRTVTPHTRAFPGVAATLDACRKAGLQLAVATSKTVRIARETLEVAGLADAFALVLGVDSVARPKPAPDMVLRVLAELGAAPGRTLVVGDAGHDVAMGRSAGARTCAVTYGVQTRAELLAAEPDCLVDRFGDVLGIVRAGLP